MAAAERPPFFWVFAALGLLCLGAFAVGGVSIVRDGHLRKAFGWTAGSDHAGLYIRSVDPTGIAAGVLEPGDRVLAWNGDRRLARVGLAPYQWSTRTGETYQLVIHRAGRDHTVELRVPLVVESRQRTQTAALFLLGVFFAVIGVLIGLLRPVQGPARWVALAFIAGGLQHMKTALGSVNAPETGRPWIVDLLCVTPLQTICAYEFAIRFPFTRLSTLTRAFSSVLWTLGLTVVVTCIWTGVLSLYLGNIDAVARQAGWIRLTDLLRPLAFVAAGIAASWTLIRRYQFVAEPDLRRRLAWVVYGAIIGGTPLLLPPILAFATGARNRPEGSSAWLLNLYAITDFMTVALALSMSYAVLRHRVFDIRVVLRRTVQYTLAKNVLMASLAVPAVALAYSVISNPGMTIAEFLSVGSPYVYVAAALGLTIRFRRVLRAYIDRQFLP